MNKQPKRPWWQVLADIVSEFGKARKESPKHHTITKKTWLKAKALRKMQKESRRRNRAA